MKISTKILELKKVIEGRLLPYKVTAHILMTDNNVKSIYRVLATDPNNAEKVAKQRAFNDWKKSSNFNSVEILSVAR
jgi:hypothetical protein